MKIPATPTQKNEAAIKSRLNHPLFGEVAEAIMAQDLLILAGYSDKKSLDWVIDLIQSPMTDESSAKSVSVACAVFDGIVKAIQGEKSAHYAQPEIDAAKKYCTEILLWSEDGWKEFLSDFLREMRGINPQTLKNHLGFSSDQLTLTKKVEGKPQWGELSLLDIAVRVVEEESVLTNRAFRRAALSAISSFFLFAFGQTGSEESELLDCSDEILILLYGDGAKLANRSAKKR
ncbi:MAG: hypothetical protein NTY56_01650 [Patescibacteria group bacterium]|nr:hypothetical protein [Patescibacteria group bacterium]